MKSIYPTEAKAILFLLTNRRDRSEEIIAQFTPILGPVEIQTGWHPFPKGHYYEKEMGPDLERCLVGFKNMFEPWRLAELKTLCHKLEHQHIRTSTHPYGRIINIDPGYVDLFKVVLASGKGGGQKVAIARDIFAHPLLRYEKGGWIPFEWTFPDLKAPTYHKELLRLRASLRALTRPVSGATS